MKFAYRSLAAVTAATAVGMAGYSLAQAQAPAAQPSAPASAADLKPGVYKADPGHTKITWSVSHNGFSTYSGQIADVNADLTVAADPTKSSLTVTVPLARNITGNAGLDRHMSTADFFNVEKFANATFKSTSVAVTGPNTGRVTGDLTLGGVTKPVTLNVVFRKGAAGRNGAGYQLGFDATGVVKRSEFGMNFGIPNVSDEVELRIGSEFRSAAPAA